jgi:O-antigen/teichoic acid export membrane protein
VAVRWFSRKGAIAASALLVGTRGLAAVVAIIVQIALARLLAPDQLGLYFLAASAASLAALPASLGYPSLTAGMMARYRIAGRVWLGPVYPRRTTLEVAVISALVAAVLALAALAIGGAAAPAIAIGALAIPALALARQLGALANAQRRFAIGFLPDLIGRPLAFVAGLALFVAIGSPIDANVTIALFLAAAMAALAIQTGLTWPRLPRAAARPRRRPHRLVGRWRRAALPLVLVALFTASFADLALLAAAPFLSAADLALYAICLKSALLAGFVIQVLHQVALPEIAEALASGDPARARRHAVLTNRLATGAMLAALLLALLAGPAYLGLFGHSYRDGAGLLAILVLALIARAWMGPATHVLTLAGRSGRNAAIAAASTLALVTANVLLIPHFGLNGAALAAGLALAIWAALAARATTATPCGACHGLALHKPRRSAGAAGGQAVPA